MGDSPPKYGFLPNVYQQECPPNTTASVPDIYSGVALSYGMPIPYQQPSPTSESPQTTPYPLTNPYPSLTTQTESIEAPEILDSGTLKVDPSGFAWQFIEHETPFPYNQAVRAGRDADGTAIYAGRAFHEGDMIPAKVHPQRRVAYICHNGEEIPKYEYEILRSGDFCWEFACSGEIPAGAVECGKTADGEALYMGRCLYRGTQTPGKLHPSHGCLYIPFNGEEVAVTEYEVLTLK